MKTVIAKPIPEEQRRQGRRTVQYPFKPASEMPVIKWDYVVQSPTPLGQRPVKVQNEQE